MRPGQHGPSPELLAVVGADGQLLAETDASHTTTREYLWLEDWPVAMVSMNGGTARLDFIHADHLGTPRRLTDSQQAVIWRWDSAPFGDSTADADPDGDSINTTFNLRFPGQYFDSESGLHYNYFRDYDPGTGRYVQSDPIGLAGGINTYSYVSGSPLIKIDPTGLIEWRGTVLSGGAGPLAGEIYTLRTECIDGKRGFARIHAVGGSLGLGATWAGGKVSFEDGNPGLKSNISDIFDGIYAKAGMGAAWGIGVQLGVTRLGSAITTFGEEFGVQGGLDSSIGFGFGRSTVIESRIEECSNECR